MINRGREILEYLLRLISENFLGDQDMSIVIHASVYMKKIKITKI